MFFFWEGALRGREVGDCALTTILDRADWVLKEGLRDELELRFIFNSHRLWLLLLVRYMRIVVIDRS